jgi:hypothetical protein
MLIPRFSLRWLLAVMTLCGLLAYVVSQAVMGKAWGIAFSVAIGALLVTAIVYALVFILAWGIASIVSGSRKRRASSPFATDTAPPQIVPPQEIV